MPVIDMPVKELLQYQGRNEKPEDFDAYWDESIREMEVLGTEAEFIPAELQVRHAECYHVYFKGVGGSRVHGVYIKPKKVEKPLPAIIEFHGYGDSLRDFYSKMGWIAAGFCVAALDCRGQNGLSEDLGSVRGNTMDGLIIRGLEDDDPKKLHFRNVFLDTAQFARIIAARPEVDATRMGATGGSQGGGLTLACAALTPWLALAAPRMPFLSDYRRVWEMDLDVAAYHELRSYFRSFDPRHLREKEIFAKLGYIDVHNLAPRIKAKVRMYTGLIDTICPPSTQFAAYNHIQAPKDYVLYPDFAHETIPDQLDDIVQFMQQLQAE